jgi:hypothetical protein
MHDTFCRRRTVRVERSVGRRSGHRAKAGPLTLGATRSRLIEVVQDLGIYGERIATRFREEQRWAELLEAVRVACAEEEQRAAQILEARRLARLRESELAPLVLERRRFVRLLKEELAFQRMTEEQKTAERWEEQIVVWMTANHSVA